MMKFSILIANYNNGKFFKNCYDSIIKQNYPNWEDIILDDCSTDNSVELIKSIIGEDDRFRVFENKINRGVGYTKGKLIELADGYLCGFVDPDDALSYNSLFSSVITFTNEVNIVLTYSRYINCDENLVPIDEPGFAKQIKNNDPYFFNCPIQVGHFVVFRKDIYEKTTGMDPTLKIAVDQDLYLKLYEKGKFKFINDINYYYRLHDNGISQNDNKAKARESFAKLIFEVMKRRNLKYINGKPIPQYYHSSSEIYDLLEYKNSFLYRVKNKAQIMVESFLENFF